MFYKIYKKIISYFLYFINIFITKDKHALLFIPHSNCKNDGYDIINCGADNALVLCNNILRDNRFANFSITIVIYESSKESEYLNYCRNIGFKGIVHFVLYNDMATLVKRYCHSSIIFTDNYYAPFEFKSKKQKTICLGYFVCPFKDDYFKIQRWGYRMALYKERLNNRIFDYHISTSDFCSRELSVDSLLYLPKYKPLGFPRNDLFFDSSINYRDKLTKSLGFSPKTIIAYVPTHRDYERENSRLYDKEIAHTRTIFGTISKDEEKKINNFLEQEDAVLIAKIHSIQNTTIINQEKQSRIVYFSDLVKKSPINLQEILSGSDMMITDYSTACFDYLLTDRPCIYYFYDYEEERSNRGFFINPVSAICAGDIVYNITDLCEAIKDNLSNPMKYAFKRQFVRDLLFQNMDGNSTNRVKEFVLTIVK